MEQVIKPEIVMGAPCDKWDYVQSIQDNPFIYIMSNGFYREDLNQLFIVLSKYRLNERFKLIENDLVEGSPSYDWLNGKSEVRFDLGKPLYKNKGVTRFFGNFKKLFVCF